MTDSTEPAPREQSGSRLTRVAIWALVVIVGLAVLVFVPGPVLTAMHKRDAAELIDRVSDRRSDVIVRAAGAGEVLAPLGEPVQAWSEVSCSLRPSLSNGDGPTVTMSYLQSCVPVVHEIYALPAKHRSLKKAASLLKGRLGHWELDCNETILDVAELRLGQIDPQGFSMDLRWIDPAGTSRTGDSGRCALPSPDDPGVTRVEWRAEGALTAPTYVVFTVVGKAETSNVGCERHFYWIGGCTATPEGTPYL